MPPPQADARTILEIDLAGMARALDVFDSLVGEGTAAVCVASIAGHLGGDHVPPDALIVIDDPLSEAVLSLTDDPSMAYMMSKLGVMRMVRRKALQWGSRGGRCVSVSPGVIETPMGTLEMASGNGTAEVAAMGAFGRLGQAAEVAQVIAFLCSPAASFITATDILVDGGVVAALRR